MVKCHKCTIHTSNGDIRKYFILHSTVNLYTDNPDFHRWQVVVDKYFRKDACDGCDTIRWEHTLNIGYILFVLGVIDFKT